MANQSKKPKNILVTADLGASNPKFIVNFGKKQQFFLILDSKVQKVPKALLNKYRKDQDWMGERKPAEDAYLELADDDSNGEDDCWCFGSLSEAFTPEERLDKNRKKYELAGLKILAGLGIICQREGIKARHFNLNLSVLLPATEYGDRERFWDSFRQFAQQWRFREEWFSCTLGEFLADKEGAGVLRYVMSEKEMKKSFQDQKIGLLMAGYRNVTFLVLNQGRLALEESPVLGFHECVESIAATNASLSPNQLNQALGEGYYELLQKEMTEVPEGIRKRLNSVLDELPDDSEEKRKKLFWQRLEEKDLLSVAGKLFSYRLKRVDSNRTLALNEQNYCFSREGKVPDFWEVERIKRLIQVNHPTYAQAELNDLISTIEEEITAYNDKMKLFLERYFQGIETLFLVGGASIFLYPCVSQFCNRLDQVTVNFHHSRVDNFTLPYLSNSVYRSNEEKPSVAIETLSNLRETLAQEFGLETSKASFSSIPIRFLDSYCWDYLSKIKIKEKKRQAKKQEKAN